MNIGNPDEHAVKDLAGIVLELTDSTSSMVYERLPTDDPTRRRPDITLARRVLGWSPETSLRDGVARTVDYFCRLVTDAAPAPSASS